MTLWCMDFGIAKLRDCPEPCVFCKVFSAPFIPPEARTSLPRELPVALT